MSPAPLAEPPRAACTSRGAAAPAASAALATAALLLAACNTIDGPEVIRLTSSEYPTVFEACLDQARDAGMPAILTDRSIGIIETKPRHVGSLMEPWRLDSSGLGQTAAATIQFERRRARFEFTPAGMILPAPTGEGPIAGPLVPGSEPDEARFDLEHYQGPIELRAWVFVERGFTPGLKPGRWSLSLTTTWTDAIRDNAPREPGDTSTRSPTEWTPMARDEAMERTLLARVQEQLARRASAAPAAPIGGAAGDAAPDAAPATAPR